MKTKAIIKDNIKKIEIERTKTGITIGIVNVIENERVACYTVLSKDEVKLLINQLQELGEFGVNTDIKGRILDKLDGLKKEWVVMNEKYKDAKENRKVSEKSYANGYKQVLSNWINWLVEFKY